MTDTMRTQWVNVDAGPRQTKNLLRVISALRSEGQSHDEITGVIGGKEHRFTLVSPMGDVRPEVLALDAAIRETYGNQVTRKTLAAITAAYEAAVTEARTSRPVEDNRHTAEEETARAEAAHQRDAQYQAARPLPLTVSRCMRNVYLWLSKLRKLRGESRK